MLELHLFVAYFTLMSRFDAAPSVIQAHPRRRRATNVQEAAY